MKASFASRMQTLEHREERARREERGGGGGREGRTHVESVVVDDFCCGRVRVEMSRFLGFGELDSELRDQSLVF